MICTIKKPRPGQRQRKGSHPQNADLILFVHRAELYEERGSYGWRDAYGLAEKILEKQRNGPTGDIAMEFIHETADFREPAMQEAQV